MARAAAHLKLVIGNIMSTSWIAGSMLHTQPAKAQLAANTLLRHLDTTHPDKRTAFERHLSESPELMRSMTDFANREVPICLWQGGAPSNPCSNSLPFDSYWLQIKFLIARGHMPDGIGCASRSATCACP